MKIDILQGCSGLEWAVPAIRFSWKQFSSRSDSKYYTVDGTNTAFIFGEEDKALAQRLVLAGPSHRKFLRMVFAYMDVTAPLYWWKQFDTHRFGVEKISESTMHSILVKPFEIDDFEHVDTKDVAVEALHESYLKTAIGQLNIMRNKAMSDKHDRKECENAIYHMLPDSFLQKRRVCLSYEAMLSIYILRRGHKLKEWHEFCSTIEAIPEFKIFVDALKSEAKEENTDK